MNLTNIVLATTTKETFQGKALASVDPALGIARNKRKLVHKLRTENNPFGNGIEGNLGHFYATYKLNTYL